VSKTLKYKHKNKHNHSTQCRMVDEGDNTTYTWPKIKIQIDVCTPITPE